MLQADLLPFGGNDFGMSGGIYHLVEDVTHEACFSTDAADVKISDEDSIGFPKLINNKVHLVVPDGEMGSHFKTVSEALTPLAVRLLVGYFHDRKAEAKHSNLAGFKENDVNPADGPKQLFKFYWGSGSVDKENRLHTVSHNVRTLRVADGHVWRLVHIAFARDNVYDVSPTNVILGREPGWLLAYASDILYNGLEGADDVDYAMLDVSKAEVIKKGDIDFRSMADFKSTPEVPIDVEGN